MPANDTAIVALAIGEPYLSNWNRYCAPAWQMYAQNSGYDLIVMTEPLDRSHLASTRSPAWQKCLVLGQDAVAGYRQVVLLDCDIAINAKSAPRVTDGVPVDRVAGVLSGAHIADDLKLVFLIRMTARQYSYEPGLRHWHEFHDEAYRACGLTPVAGGVVQTGVLVASPQYHRELFQAVYTAPYSYQSRAHEQIPLSHALLGGGHFLPIDSRFNSVFYETLLVHYPYLQKKETPGFDVLAKYATRVSLANNFFLHFAYNYDFIKYLID